MAGKLWIVPTPIGNLEDITLRAIRILKSCHVILAEDTRQSIKLLKHYEISVPLQSYHMHNEHQATQRVIAELESGKNIALISDAGTPGISDPGFLLVREAVAAGLEAECLPGPTAFIPALVQSGFPIHEFSFLGFLPQKKGRQTAWEKIVQEMKTVVVYESPYRVLKFLEEAVQKIPERQLCACRELTKMFAENVRGTPQELLEHFTRKEPKGEFVIVISAATEKRKKKYEDSPATS